jgi:HSP20 family protein
MFREWKKNDLGVFDGIEKELEEMNRIMNHLINHSGSKMEVHGFIVQIGPDGIPHMEQFGNFRPVHEAAEITKVNVREPFVSSIIDKRNKVLNITAEMPGIHKKDIEVSATEKEVIIKTEGERKYYTKIPVPCPVNPDSANAKYNNGLLEVTLELMDTIEPEGKSIKIQ